MLINDYSPNLGGNKGVLPGQEGEILQRGGEELRLRQVKNRLTIGLSDLAELASLTAQWQPQKVRNITPQAIGASLFIVEWQLSEAELESALSDLRAMPMVVYASHVYELEVSPGTYVYLANQLTVQFADGLQITQVEAIAHSVGIIRSHALPDVGLNSGPTYCFIVGPSARQNPLKIANQLARHPDVLLAEPNIILATAPLYRPTDSRYSEQWHLYHRSNSSDLAPNSHVFAEKAWDMTRGSRSVVIAITDDGFDLAHPDLQGAGKIVAPRDLKNQDGLPTPTAHENHGTAVAGVALAEENGQGIVGIAPGCSLMPIQTTGFLDDSSIEALFNWAVSQGADVISCSWSPAAVYFPLSRRISQAINRAATQGRDGKGCVIVFSAGNANRPVEGKVEESGWAKNLITGVTNWLSGFAIHPDVITVSACTSLSRKAAYSNWGRHISVAAPSNNAPPNMSLSEGTFTTGPQILQTRLKGRAVLTSDRTGSDGYTPDDYAGFGGTSSACPLVAGIVGLMLSVNPDLSASEVKQLLQSTTDKIIDSDPDPQLGQRYGTYDSSGHSFWFGYGKVNAYQAVKAAQERALKDRALHQTLTVKNSTVMTIPDNNPQGIFSSINVTANGSVQDIKVYIHAEHEFLSDLSFTLKSPKGDAVLIQGRTLGRQTRLQRTYSLVSTPSLRRLLNTSAQGRWQLQVIDHVANHVGQLKKWELVLGL
ncbi:MAG: S8 family serine peptidase [Phormidesmis sp. RL_2_1]|nr:S8 family serine peptidase [Phormidesmis sp. RL_2_1]